MNLTKRTLCVIMALAVVFSTLVAISVGASVDFPIHNTYVTLSGGKTQNCEQKAPMYEADGKIGYVSSEEFTVNAWFQSDASKLSELVQESEAMGECVCIDLYAEFTSELNNTRVGASVNFGAGDVLPKAKYTNVANPTTDYAVDFVNGKIVTLKLWIDDIVQVGTINDLDQVMISVFPASRDKVTGTFFYSAPYIESKDGEHISTVNITSIKTTTTKPDEKYEGAITCYDSGVTFAGSHEVAKAQWGAVNECYVYYGNYTGFENKYVHIDGSGKQMQVMNMVMNGLEQLRARAKAADKSICIDIYSNEFTNGGHKNAKCDTFMNFGGTQIGGDDDSERIVIRSGIKQTIVFPASSIPENATKWNITFQNYSYGDYANISDAKFIITAPYVEGDAPLSAITPSTKQRPTNPPKESWDGETIVSYNNGVQLPGGYNWANLTNGKVVAGQTFVKDDNGSETSYVKVTEPSESASVESSQESSETPSETEEKTSSVKGKYIKNYVHIDSQPRQQIQVNSWKMSGYEQLYEKAIENNERMFIDIYGTGMNSSGYFFVSIGNYTTNAMACQVDNKKKQTLELDVDSLPSSASSISMTIQNYSFSPYTVGGKFIVSVPYLESDMTESKIDTSTYTTTTTTTTGSTAPTTTLEIETGELPLQIPNSNVKYTSGWGNPEAYYVKDEGKISYLNVFSSYGNQLQMYNNATGLPELLVQAAEEGKNVCVDFYGNFTTKAGTAKIRLNVGNGIWYGADSRTDNPDKSDINGDKMLTIKPKTVTTLKINPQKMFDYLRSTSTTVKVDKSEKQFESLEYTGDITPKSFTQSDIEPKSAKLHQLDDVSKNDYIEYTIPDMKASTYSVKLNTRDLSSSGEYAVYINGQLIDTIDFYSQSKTYKTRDLGEFVVAKDGNVTVKFVSKGNYDGTALMLDSIKFTDLFEEETTTAAQNTNETLAAKCKAVAVAIWGNGSWGGDWSTTGRFYMTVPYIEGTTKGNFVEGVTTTTTTQPPSTKQTQTVPSDMNNIDLGYVDCKFDTADWNANGSSGSRVLGNKAYKFGVSGTQAQQIGAQLNVNGGSITKKFNDTDPNTWDYVSYAREAGAMIAMDVYPTFSMSDGGSLYCHMNTSWNTTKASDKEYEAEDIIAKSGLIADTYSYNEVDYNTAIADLEDKIFDKYVDVKVGDEILYTFEGLNLARYKISAPAILSANGAEFQVYIDDKKLDKVSFNSETTKYGSVVLSSAYKLTEEGNVTIKLVCTKAGELVVDKFNFNEGSFSWPTNIKDFKITSGKTFTYYIDPYDIPTGSSKFSVYFDSYEYAPGWRAMQGVEIYLTAPYLVDVKNVDKTTTTTTTATQTTTRPTTSITYAYPSNNGGGKTRFTVGDVKCGPTDTIKVPINLTDNVGMYNAKFSVKFNPNNLFYLDCTNGEVFENINVNTDEADDGIIHITLTQSSSDTFANGAVAYLEFDTTSSEGCYPISFAGSGYIPANFFDFNAKKVPCSFRTGYVMIDTSGTMTRPADYDAIKAYPTNNDGTTRFTIESVKQEFSADNAGKEIEVKLSVSGNAGISSAKFTVQYDTNALEFIGSTPAGTIPPVFNLLDYNLDPIEYDPGILTYNITQKDDRVVTESNRNGDIVILKFKIKDYKEGNYAISFGGESYNAKYFVDSIGSQVPCSFTSGGIEITKKQVTGTTSITSAKLTDKKVANITWTKVDGATEYKVLRSVGASADFIELATVTDTSYTDKSLLAGKKYNYKILVVDSNSTSDVASVTTMKYTKPVIKSLKPGKKSIKVTIKKKATGVVGFQIKASLNKKFKKNTKTVTSKKVTKTIKKLKSGKKYFVKVRAYNVINGKKVYGKWSKVKAKVVK